MSVPDFVLLTTRTVTAEAEVAATANRPRMSAPATARRILGRVVRDRRAGRGAAKCDIRGPSLLAEPGRNRAAAWWLLGDSNGSGLRLLYRPLVYESRAVLLSAPRARALPRSRRNLSKRNAGGIRVARPEPRRRRKVRRC